MARRLIPLLLLLNGLLVLWALGMDRLIPVSIPGQTPREPDRVAQQVRAESIRIVAQVAPVAASARTASAASAVSAAAPASASAPAPAQASSPAPAAPVRASGAAPALAAPAPAAPAAPPARAAASAPG